MAKSYKVLGQISPSATTATTAYTVPSNTETVISTITICNRSASAVTYRIAIRPDGEALADKHYIAYDSSISANDTVALTLGITLNQLDVITVYASSTNLSFNFFGSEIV
jgi:hypothetical protein